MARQPVTQIQCDRCKRTYFIPLQTEEKPAAFSATFLDAKLHYQDLCDPCVRAIKGLWEHLREWERELKQSMIGPAIPENQAPPLSAAPDYSPPKPHSPAGAKRS
jgi:hypothetical protein